VGAVLAAAALALSGCQSSTYCGVPVLSFLFCSPNEQSAPVEHDGNNGPQASFTATPLPNDPLTLEFSNTSGDPDGGFPGLQSIDESEWDLDGDGTYETLGDPEWSFRGGFLDVQTHTYPAAGTYTVRLRVRDWDGAEGGTERPIQVGGSTSTPTGPGAPLRGAGVTPPHAFLGRLSLGRIDGARARRRARSLRGVRVRGRLRGSIIPDDSPYGPPTAPSALARFLRSPFVGRIAITTNRGRTRQRITAVALAKLRPGRVCFTLRLTNRDGRQPAGTLRLLGGTGAGATLRGSGRFRGELRSARVARIGGTIRTRGGRSRGLPVRCRGLRP
jgi:hypothetical protein